MGTGVYRNFDEAAERTIRIRRTVEPNPETARANEKGYRTYRRLYEKLKDLMKEEDQ